MFDLTITVPAIAERHLREGALGALHSAAERVESALDQHRGAFADGDARGSAGLVAARRRLAAADRLVEALGAELARTDRDVTADRDVLADALDYVLGGLYDDLRIGDQNAAKLRDAADVAEALEAMQRMVGLRRSEAREPVEA